MRYDLDRFVGGPKADKLLPLKPGALPEMMGTLQHILRGAQCPRRCMLPSARQAILAHAARWSQVTADDRPRLKIPAEYQYHQKIGLQYRINQEFFTP